MQDVKRKPPSSVAGSLLSRRGLAFQEEDKDGTVLLYRCEA
jgi:hypothetical protein